MCARSVPRCTQPCSPSFRLNKPVSPGKSNPTPRQACESSVVFPCICFFPCVDDGTSNEQQQQQQQQQQQRQRFKLPLLMTCLLDTLTL
jgi:hypothetical protein